MKHPLLLVLCISPLAFAQPLKLDSLDKLAPKATETVKVTLDSKLLGLASGFLSNDDPDEVQVKQLIKGLKGIYVRSFEFSDTGQYAGSDVDAIRKQLRDASWKTIVEVHNKDQNDNTDVYVKDEGDHFGGIAIVSAEPKQLTIVHIDGVIDLDGLSKLAGNFGIPDDIRSKTERKRK
jgi:hypothetical protein